MIMDTDPGSSSQHPTVEESSGHGVEKLGVMSAVKDNNQGKVKGSSGIQTQFTS